MLKKIHWGKLEVAAMKCRLLSWWADKTKGYRLEDVETCLLITSLDVCFVEDNTPSELAVIEGSDMTHTHLSAESTTSLQNNN
jgi:hypothetical protein